MANIYRPNYDPSINAGTSGAETSDRNAGADYNVDLRYGDKDEEVYSRRADNPTVSPSAWPEKPTFTKEGDSLSKRRAEKFIQSAKAAGKFKTSKDVKEYTINGKTPRQPSYTNAISFGPSFGALETPSMGSNGGRSGATDYANKPQPNAGKPYNWLDVFS